MLHATQSKFLAVLFGVLLVTAGCVTGGEEPVTERTDTQPADQQIAEVSTEVDAPSLEVESLSSPFDPSIVELGVKEFLNGLKKPVFATHANDGSGRLFIVEQAGHIRIYHEGTLLETPFIDISERVNDKANEQGLLGLAFAPDYAESGHFFVNYTDSQGDTVIARFQMNTDEPNMADPNSEFVVLNIEQPARNHNGGMVAFGPDGYLYIGTGDGGAANDRYDNGQNPATLLGKMLRLDVTSAPDQPYLVPADNPWVDAQWQGADVRDEIWSIGLRNPWRFSFDRLASALWIGDVGQNEYEEIHYTAPNSGGGHNYGWPIMEGIHCFGAEKCDQSGLILPVQEQSHPANCSITGGYVYRGSAYPILDGVYFYSDFCSGTVWAFYANTAGEWVNEAMLDSGLLVSSFAEDEAGELYLLGHHSGTIFQLIVVSE